MVLLAETTVVTVFWFLLVAFLVVAGFTWHFRRSRQLLENWAERNGYEILEAEYRHMFKGPFFFRSTRDQTVYRVTVRDKAGVHRGWVRCGGWFFGLMTDKAEVRWDEPEAVKAAAPREDLMADRWFDA
ncbi:hypothetical protein OJF2_42960 [Aquisphaera giovannonii]|uniref:DUF3301 domain-containing protein n=1 Tax=Aquisphaera giovannonii TaxID=406548 RepID=A0A5B9W6F4_9BACT|nr:hypothetical protein [Aquisphaera giovannonii]QEH35739.1 hypothetical protein OJF2_42960 [Aquisphaera giovannonii]